MELADISRYCYPAVPILVLAQATSDVQGCYQRSMHVTREGLAHKSPRVPPHVRAVHRGPPETRWDETHLLPLTLAQPSPL